MRRQDVTDEFFRLRRNLSDLALLDKIEAQLKDIIETEPDRAVGILQTLAVSDTNDRDLAAIYIGYLFPHRYEQARAITQTLLADPDEDIRQKTRETLDEAVEYGHLTALDAARIIATQT
jgi:lipopolysaccharide biosynthesis regulator YciM